MTHVDHHAPGTCAWVDLMADDPAAARAFYGDLFGWTFEVSGPEMGHYAMASLGGRRVAGVGGKPPGAPMPTAWSVYFAVESCEATIAAVKEAGGALAMGPMEIPGQGHMAVCSEPTGGVFGLWQPLSHKGHEVENEPGAFAWTELNTRDLARASTFLQRVFGYQAVNMDGMPYATLHLGADKKTVAGGIMQMDDQRFPAHVPPHWAVYFATADVDATAAAAAARGGQLLAPAFDTEYGRIAVLRDPQGGVFSVIQLSAKALAM